MTDPRLPAEPRKASLSSSLRLSDLGFALPPIDRFSVATPDDGSLCTNSPAAGELQEHLLGSAPPPSIYPDAPAMIGALNLNTPTPSKEMQQDLSFQATVGAPFPTDVSTQVPPMGKHSLRLPSFEALGIAAPHPDRKLGSPVDFSAIGSGPLSKPCDPLHLQSPQIEPAHPDNPQWPDSNPNRKQISHLVSTFTPPAEASQARWPNAYANVTTAALESPAQSDPDRTTPNIARVSSSGTPSGTQQTFPVQDLSKLSTSERQWLDEAIQTLLDNINLESVEKSPLKVLSHALPTPSATGHAFPAIINRILELIQPKPTTWINVFHAVPGRFNLSDLPTSPPNTPGTANEGEDYFTTKVFDSAVPVTDYEGDATPLPRSPRPAVPPGSINIAIVERYIPPPSPTEATRLFQQSGRSILSDRLVELSPNSGLLFLAYPTKTGGRTFSREYLGPILEPLLRSMAIINELSADLGSSLHQMSSVEHLVEYGELRESVEHFCRQLSTSANNLSRFHPDRKTTYQLIHARREEISIEREVWSADWWIKQEKPRVRKTVAKYFRQSHKIPADAEDIIPTAMIQEILDGVAAKSQPNAKPRKGIEIGVFVIKKTS